MIELPIEVQFSLVLLASLASLVVGFVLGRRRRRWAIAALVIGFATLAVSILPRLFPPELYFLFPSSYLGEIALGGAFLMSGVLAATYANSAFRIILQVILAPLMVYFVLGAPGYLAFNADYIRGLDYEVVDGVTLQSDNFGCVPSSLATVFRRYGLEYTEGELAYALRTTPMGTDFNHIPQVVRELGRPAGLEVEFLRTTVDELRRIDRPGVLIVYSGRILHAVALLGFSGDDIVIGDPLSGIRRIRADEFESTTRWTRLAALVWKPGA